MKSDNLGDKIDNKLLLNLIYFSVAMRFLTLIPLKWKQDQDMHYMKESVAYFPVVGVVIGGLASLLSLLLTLIFPPHVVAVLVVIFLALISGGLHLDGLSDSADGMLSARPRERALEIMKDSRVGAMGVIILFCSLLAKYSGLVSIDPAHLAVTVAFIPFAGRCTLVYMMALLPYARKEGGLGDLFYSKRIKVLAVKSLLIMIVAAIYLFSYQAIVVLLAIVLTVVFFSIWCSKKLGGATGDTLGAGCELTEAIVALALTCTIFSF